MLLPNGTHTHAFSPEAIAATHVPAYNRETIHWFKADRQDAIDGAMRFNPHSKQLEHNGLGLDHAVSELARLERDHEAATGDRKAILAIMVTQQRCFVQFWEGKIALLDRLIAAAQAQP